MNNTNDIGDTVQDDLTFDPDVDASDIRVRNTSGEVVLEGTVPSYPQYVAAAAVARRVAGVKDVHNHLEVVLPPGDFRDDQALAVAANSALTLNNTAQYGIDATATNGTVTLTGTVRDSVERAAAELLVAGLTGVHSVTNDIQIRNEADPGNGTRHV
jgi:osmotically-inducible protein OsmY